MAAVAGAGLGAGWGEGGGMNFGAWAVGGGRAWRGTVGGSAPFTRNDPDAVTVVILPARWRPSRSNAGLHATFRLRLRRLLTYLPRSIRPLAGRSGTEGP